jgi:hypothetical protein
MSLRAALLALPPAIALVAGRATETKAPPSGRAATGRPASKAVPPVARYNLTGYSANFKQGYADACATPQRRNDRRFKTDTDYQMGWNDGRSLCRGQ